MRETSLLPRAGVALAILISLATTACSKPEPQTPAAAASSPPLAASDPSAASETMHTDHSAMGMAETGQAMDPNVPMAMATAETSGAFGSGKVAVTLHVTDMMGGHPMGPDSFSEVHTEKLHVLGVDPSLTDYSHSHPLPDAKAGDWRFEFTPKFNRPYHLWLDVTPIGGAQQYVMVTINDKGQPAAVEKLSSLTSVVGDVHATLSFDGPLTAGQAAMGHLALMRGGKPLAALEPVMGAYGHIVGISEDWTTIAHVHPLGSEPTRASDRGGPAIDFHLEPAQAGFLKLFAQVRVDGHDVFLPFGATVAASTKKPDAH